MRIGLLGGTFDPIHKAHVDMAKRAKKQLGLQEIWFLVAKDTPLKDRKISCFEDRCKMVEMATAAFRDFKVCTIESKFEGKSYTIDTVLYLKKKYPKHTFYFMIGADQVAQLHLWKDIELLQEKITLCAFAREGNVLDTKYKIKVLQMDNQNISSSQVRNGNFINIHPDVRKYIFKNGMYLDFVKLAMSEYRYKHSKRVAQLCVRIAMKQNLDIRKAYLCGLLHDINKEFKLISIEEAKRIIEIMRPNLLLCEKDIWHGYIARYLCEHKLYIKDKDILLAVEHHVLGGCHNIYAKLAYVSDKLDPGRDYEVEQTIQVCERNLHEGYALVRKQQKEFYGEIDECRE